MNRLQPKPKVLPRKKCHARGSSTEGAATPTASLPTSAEVATMALPLGAARVTASLAEAVGVTSSSIAACVADPLIGAGGGAGPFVDAGDTPFQKFGRAVVDLKDAVHDVCSLSCEELEDCCRTLKATEQADAREQVLGGCVLWKLYWAHVTAGLGTCTPPQKLWCGRSAGTSQGSKWRTPSQSSKPRLQRRRWSGQRLTALTTTTTSGRCCGGGLTCVYDRRAKCPAEEWSFVRNWPHDMVPVTSKNR